MGDSANISIIRFPKQADSVGSRVEVCFHFNTKNTIEGTVVRDDREDPFRTIIRLDDGRFVLATECQWRPAVTPTRRRVLLDVTELVPAIQQYMVMGPAARGELGPLNAAAYIGERLVATYLKYVETKHAEVKG